MDRILTLFFIFLGSEQTINNLLILRKGCLCQKCLLWKHFWSLRWQIFCLKLIPLAINQERRWFETDALSLGSVSFICTILIELVSQVLPRSILYRYLRLLRPLRQSYLGLTPWIQAAHRFFQRKRPQSLSHLFFIPSCSISLPITVFIW